MKNLNLQIREAVHSDLPSLARLSRDTFISAFAPFNKAHDMEMYVSQCLSDEKLRIEMADADTKFLLAVSENTIAGYAKIKNGAEADLQLGLPALEVERLYVRQDFQNNGLGETLLDFIIDYATKNRFKTVWLGVWEHNINALRFYKRNGMVEFGSHPFLLGTDLQTDLLLKIEINK